MKTAKTGKTIIITLLDYSQIQVPSIARYFRSSQRSFRLCQVNVEISPIILVCCNGRVYFDKSEIYHTVIQPEMWFA